MKAVFFLIFAFLLSFSAGAERGLRPGGWGKKNIKKTKRNKKNRKKWVEPTFMTRNVYLGADLIVLGDAQTPQDALAAALRALQVIEMTDFPTRAIALAAEVLDTQPDFIGLQEVTRNSFSIGETVLSEEDFLPILIAALQDNGLSYSVASEYRAQVLGPLVVNPSTGMAATQTLRNVILVKNDPRIELLNGGQASFLNQFSLQTSAGLTFSPNRGYQYIDVRVPGFQFRFVNTHLELEMFGPINALQADELKTAIVQDGYRKPIVLVGDLNSDSDGGEGFEVLTLDGFFQDAWALQGIGPGLTCCHVEDLANVVDLEERIDVVFFREGANRVKLNAQSARLVGDEPFQDTQPIFASDHVGVVANIRMERYVY